MIIPEKYQCDKCERVLETRMDVLSLSVNAQHGPYSSSVKLEGNHALMVCISCAEQMGIRQKKGAPKEEQVPAPTMEDLIRQIIEMVTEE